MTHRYTHDCHVLNKLVILMLQEGNWVEAKRYRMECHELREKGWAELDGGYKHRV